MFTALILHAILLSGDPPTYPSTTTEKTLYAEKDLRGKPAPKFVVEQWLNGPLPDTKGKVLIVDFWATWCPPCRATIPELNGYAKKFANDVVVMGISGEQPDVVRKFMATTPMNYTVGIDTANRSSKEIGVQGIPHVLVISPDGIVRWQGFPLDQKETLTEATIAQIIAASKASKSGS